MARLRRPSEVIPDIPWELWHVAAAVALAASLAAIAIPRRWRAARPVVAASVAIAFVALGVVALMADAWAGLSASWLFCAVFAGVGAAVAAVAYARHGSRLAVGLATAFAAGMVALHALDLTPVKPHRRFYDTVTEGMTVAEVLAALRREFPDGGRSRAPAVRSDSGAISLSLDLADGRYDAEVIWLEMRGDRVRRKEYHPD